METCSPLPGMQEEIDEALFDMCSTNSHFLWLRT
uniref:Uncharacterized protein n=1 Tax=Anguilla anguilla TaxID=7936 RepID=A0A0E9VUJ0_ANGAN